MILQNYGATIQRFARGADSIMTASTFPDRSPSPSPEVSFLNPSLDSCSTYITAPSHRTEDPVASLASRSTDETARLHLTTDTRLASPEAGASSDTESTSTIEHSAEKERLEECQQLFVKGLAAHTIVLSSLESPIYVSELKNLLYREVGIPEAFITLLHGGKRLEDPHTTTSHAIRHNPTLQGYVYSASEGDFRDELEEREIREFLFSGLSSSASTMDGASLGYYARKESTKQKLYTNYLKARTSFLRLPVAG